MNTLGSHIKLTSYGESHGEVVGAILDGFPAGFEIDFAYIQRQLDRRKPGQSAISTPRKESDICSINSGLFEGKTTGAPLNFVIENTDAQSSDYTHLKDVFRPSHADFTYQAKYGIRDYRGGGRSSARITAAWVAAGALAQQYLEKLKDIKVGAYVKKIGTLHFVNDAMYYPQNVVDSNIVRCPNEGMAKEMISAIEKAKEDKDSLGGVIECVITGLPAGVGNPLFNKLNAALAQAMFSINAVKGFEVGGGFDMTDRRGSEVNDAFILENGKMSTTTNYSGGVQGGISNGMDVVFRVAFKPTATIGLQQKTVDNNKNEVTLEATGRHDACVVPRAVCIVETLAALVIADQMHI